MALIKNRGSYVSLSILFAVLLIPLVLSQSNPTGPDSVEVTSSEQRTDFNNTPSTLVANGGNVTLLTITTGSLADFWVGFFGNISGTITLDDANNNTFFDWGRDGFTVAGRIYAGNETVTSWDNVTCLNFSSTNQEETNLTTLENHFGMAPGDSQGFDETFDDITDFIIGARTLNNCNTTHVYTNGTSKPNEWNESVLYQNLTSITIFGQPLEDDYYGYDNQTYDFQLIVPDRSDTGNGAGTTYYIYIELV